MKNILTILFFFVCLHASAQLIKFSELPAASTLGGTEIVPGVQSSVNRKISINQIKTFVWDLTPTISTNDTIGFILVRRTSDGKVFKRSISSLFIHSGNLNFDVGGSLNLSVGNDLDLDVGGDIKLNGVSGTSGEFIGNVDGHLVWSVPPGTGGGAGVDNVMDINTTQAGNVTTGEDELYSKVIDKDSIDDDNDVLHARFSGTLAGNGNTKTIKVYWGTDLIVNFSGTFTSTWTINCEIIRVNSTLQHSNCAIVGASSGITHSNVVNDLDQDLSSDVEISLTGESTEGTTNDIVFETATIFRNTGGGGSGGGLTISNFVTSETPSGTVNGINDTFTLAFTPAGGVHFYINGLLQEEGTDYTIAGDTITTTTPPDTGSILLSSYIK